ncbi:MAG: hypothetical protein ACLP0B_25330 [Steroidobacteraceae bacterium]
MGGKYHVGWNCNGVATHVNAPVGCDQKTVDWIKRYRADDRASEQVESGKGREAACITDQVETCKSRKGRLAAACQQTIRGNHIAQYEKVDEGEEHRRDRITIDCRGINIRNLAEIGNFQCRCYRAFIESRGAQKVATTRELLRIANADRHCIAARRLRRTFGGNRTLTCVHGGLTDYGAVR